MIFKNGLALPRSNKQVQQALFGFQLSGLPELKQRFRSNQLAVELDDSCSISFPFPLKHLNSFLQKANFSQ